MKAIHWLRSKQEENELGYWLSFVAYDSSDRSLINKAYLLYLMIFLVMWLMFFAKYGGMALSLVNPQQSANTTVVLEWVVLACWNIYALLQSTRRSPVIFSETDQTLICQTPVRPRNLVLRWLWMPWIKSALPFWILALVLGFSTAEIHFTGMDPSNMLFSYVGFGLRSVLQIVPIQLGFFVFQWIIGVLRLHKNDQRDWIVFPSTLLGILTLALVFLTNTKSFLNGYSPLNIYMTSNFINGSGPSPLPWSLGTALLFLIILYLVSDSFSIIRAGQETAEFELISTARKYGFSDLVEQRRLQNRLSNKRNIELKNSLMGDAVMLWKNQLQQLRGFTFKQIFPLITIVSITLALPVIPGLITKILVLFFLVNQTGPLLTNRLRSDLACWPILQQLPIRKNKILIFDLASPMPLVFILSLIGITLSTLFSHAIALNYLLILPGLLATIGFTAAIDLFRKSKTDLLINGSVPSVGTQGVILGLIGTFLPVVIASAIKNQAGAIISLVLSLAIAWICYKFAVFSFNNIKS